MTTMQFKPVQENISGILGTIFNVSADKLVPDNFDLFLTGDTFRLSAVDLIYLLFEVEQAYDIRICSGCNCGESQIASAHSSTIHSSTMANPGGDSATMSGR